MKKYDQMSSGIWLLFAVYICVESVRLPLGSFRDPGPGFLPLLVGILLGVLSLISFLQAHSDESLESSESWYPRKRWKNLVWVLVAQLAYAGILDTLGFLVSTFLLLVFLFRSNLAPRSWPWAIGGSLIASVSCYVVFEILLRTQLPKGFLGF
jgi:putative tricarboxylic transport membrane protein